MKSAKVSHRDTPRKSSEFQSLLSTVADAWKHRDKIKDHVFAVEAPEEYAKKRRIMTRIGSFSPHTEP